VRFQRKDGMLGWLETGSRPAKLTDQILRMSNLPLPATILCKLLTLSACVPVLDSNAWYLSLYNKIYPWLFQPNPIPRQPDPIPDVKAVIGANQPAVFGRPQVKNISVAQPSRNGLGWAACFHAEIFGITNHNLGVQFFFVELEHGTVGPMPPCRAGQSLRVGAIRGGLARSFLEGRCIAWSWLALGFDGSMQQSAMPLSLSTAILPRAGVPACPISTGELRQTARNGQTIVTDIMSIDQGRSPINVVNDCAVGSL
jgi:hypothetical protein